MSEKEKMYQVRILFDRQESTTFGGVGAQATTLLVNEGVKDEVLKHFADQESVITVRLTADVTRYINTRNILYIDVKNTTEDSSK